MTRQQLPLPCQHSADAAYVKCTSGALKEYSSRNSRIKGSTRGLRQGSRGTTARHWLGVGRRAPTPEKKNSSPIVRQLQIWKQCVKLRERA